MEQKFEAVLFDCDGVLVDSEMITNSVLREMLIELGWDITPQECIDLFIGRALKDQWEPILKHTGFRIDDEWIAQFRARRDEQLKLRLSPIDGVTEALERVVEAFGSKIACATGADRAKVEMQLAVTGLAQFFGDRVFSGMECAQSKPAPDVYLAAAQAVEVDPTRALVIEDTVSGVTAGVRAGATVYGFSNGGPTSTDGQRLLDAGAARVFSTMHELAAAAVA